MKTDSQLQTDVTNELNWQPSVRAEDIGVQVKDGIVTLTGYVDTYGEKWDAERATQRVAGVRAVAVEIDVKLPGLHKRTDADLARSVENTLHWTSYLPQDAVKVMVENSWVTLSGEVDWDYQRKAAHNAIRYLFGVVGVSDQISVKHDPSTIGIKADVEKTLKRRAESRENNVSVEVKDHHVTLSGTSPTWWERERIVGSAWGTKGVWNVTDNISITK
jgi:osmotically-inducible protein OsmY